MTRMTRVTLLRRPTASKEKNKNDIVRAVIQTITANLSFKRLFVTTALYFIGFTFATYLTQLSRIYMIIGSVLYKFSNGNAIL